MKKTGLFLLSVFVLLTNAVAADPSPVPSSTPTPSATQTPAAVPSVAPSATPSATPALSPSPIRAPSPIPSPSPSPVPTLTPSPTIAAPTPAPSVVEPVIAPGKPRLGKISHQTPRKLESPEGVAVPAPGRPSKPTLGDIPDATVKEKKGRKTTTEPEAITPEDRKKLLEDVAEEFYEKGDVAFKEGRLQEARDLLERALTLQPGHVEAKTRLASVIRALEPPEPEPVPTPQKNSKEALLKKLSAELDDAMKNKNWEKSDRVVKNILAVDPNNDRAKTKLKSIHHQLAIKAADRAASREKAGDFQGAVDAYRVAINYFKDQAYIEKIEELTEKINEVNEKKSEELYLQALDASQNGNTGKAINLCQDALQLNPDNIQAERMLDRLQSKANP